MTEAEFLARFDRHLARLDAHIERNSDLMSEVGGLMSGVGVLMSEVRDLNSEVRDLMTEVREEMRLTREEAARSREVHEGLRTFMRDLTRRSEIVMQSVVGELAEHRDQIRANTQAVLAVLDRLGPQPG